MFERTGSIAAALVLAASAAHGGELYPRAEDVRPLLPGMKAPSFTVRDVKGEVVTIDPAQFEKPVVLTFYRGGWCPYCNLQLAELRNAEDQLQEMGFAVWFISADRPEILYDSLKQPVDYQLYSDAPLAAAQAFGIAFRVDDETFDRYQAYGLDLAAASGETHHGLPAPSTFLIGTDGVIQFQYTNPDYTVRLPPEVLLAAAQAYQKGVHLRMKKRS